jgi:DHA2 family multidrug resistance protein
VQAALQSTQQFLMTQGASATTALAQAQALVNQALNGQARLWSYVDDFRYMALVCFCCIPIVLALKKAVGRGAIGAGH